MAEQVLNQDEVELPIGPGAMLKKAREACKLSQDQIAQQLRLGVQRIREIEENDFSQMKAVIYAQGYLRAYAEIVKVPAENVLASFKKLDWARNEGQESEKTKADKWVRSSLPLSKTSVRLWVYIATAVITFVIVLFVLDYWPQLEVAKTNEAITALTTPNTASNALTTASSTTGEINLSNANEDDVADNPFVQPLTKKSSHKKVSIVEAQPVANQNSASNQQSN